MKLSAYIEKLDQVAAGSFMDRVKDDVGIMALQNIAQEFQRENDPYDARWAPIKRPGKILWKTGALSQSFSVQPTGTGIRISSNSPYAVYQQGKRNMVPGLRYGLPLKWLDQIDRILVRRLREALRAS